MHEAEGLHVSKHFSFPRNWEFINFRIFNVYLVRQCDRKDRVDAFMSVGSPLSVFEIRSVFGGADFFTQRRECWTVASRMMVEFRPERSYFVSASLVCVALEPAKTMKNRCGSRR